MAQHLCITVECDGAQDGDYCEAEFLTAPPAQSGITDQMQQRVFDQARGRGWTWRPGHRGWEFICPLHQSRRGEA